MDTIAAIATPAGIGSIGIIRISGNQALPLINKLLSLKKSGSEEASSQQVSAEQVSTNQLSSKEANSNAVSVKQSASKQSIKPRYMYHGHVCFAKTREPIDSVCCVYFKSPFSFTGEDIVEIHSHSSPLILQTILNEVVSLGARLAEPGEFTKRAFYNGKLDLTEAEAIIDLIHAKGGVPRKTALGKLEGRLSKHINNIRSLCLRLLEQMEGAMDFPDEVEAVPRHEIKTRVNEIKAILKHILDQADYGEMAHNAVKCVIAGRPNVGKSLLFNQLLGKSRAIVTSTAGTTRDFLTGQIELGGVVFDLIDTAGYRKTANKIEKLGINRLMHLLHQAHVVLWVMDHSQALHHDDLELFKKIKSKKRVILVINKHDKHQRLDLEARKFRPQMLETAVSAPIKTIQVSAKTREGVDELTDTLYTDIAKQAASLDLDLVCNIRQRNCLKQAKQHLSNLTKQLKKGFEDDVLTIDLKNAVTSLGMVTGEHVTEEVLDGIFSRFCVGK
ncbi:tRNA uridine-5-carboxymethylaminomethyl(34) synthesis GTPase MnmE [Thermoproteota archaeon]